MPYSFSPSSQHLMPKKVMYNLWNVITTFEYYSLVYQTTHNFKSHRDHAKQIKIIETITLILLSFFLFSSFLQHMLKRIVLIKTNHIHGLRESMFDAKGICVS